MPELDRPIPLSTRVEVTRREALQLFGAGLLALQAGCMQRPGEEIRPAVRRADADHGARAFYATAMVIDGYATGLLVESRGGRPTKIEGNPLHPASLGATTPQHQASILDLYDPHRVRAPRADGLPATWDRFRAALDADPAGETWLILPPDGSPSLAAALASVLAHRPGLRVVHHAAIDRRAAHDGARLAFGAPLELQLALDRADLAVALDADFLAGMPMSVRWARDFAGRRRAVDGGERPARLLVAEPMLTPTGSLADHRLAIRAGHVAALAVALSGALERRGVAVPALPAELRGAAAARLRDDARAWVERAATALARHRGAAVLLAGDRQPAAVHALAHRLAAALGHLGRTTSFTAPVAAALPGDDLASLAASLRAGRAAAVFALDVDPVRTAPRDLELGTLLHRAKLTVHAATHAGPTSAACRWLLPSSHYLESWGDARAYDGTTSLIQPLILPLHDSRSRLQILAMLAGDRAPDDRALVRARWAAALPAEAAWHAALADGIVPGTAEAPREVAPADDAGMLAGLVAALAVREDGIEIDLAPSPALLDGRFAPNPWLQELPHPITKLTWGNAAMLSEATARRLGVGDGDVLRLRAAGATVDAPALIAIGHADGCITLELGHGAATPEAPIGDRAGADAYPLAAGGRIVRGASATPTGREVALARTQGSFDLHGRELAPQLELAAYLARPDALAHLRGPLPTLLDPPRRPDDIPQWAMTIDTTICTGCSSCVVACQAENNVPVVGAAGVRKSREMHWLRIDTYVVPSPRGPEVVHQPMLCQHCEHAPCEYVCPTFATTHSPDGLNEMTYNRCVGTRFCSNNCPYKVRRFNYFQYNEPADLTALQHNPDVTVRDRGVMEKCTFCVQRIRGAEVRARIDGRPIAPGEVVTACQQACPTGAIQFAALQHATTPAMRWRRSPRLYAVLHELGTRPRTMYLAKIRDPDPEPGA